MTTLKRLAITMLLMHLTLGHAPVAASTAQIVRGRVVEENSDRPLPGAMVRIRTIDGDLVRTGTSSITGTFNLSAPSNVDIRISIATIGHETWTSAIMSLAKADTLALTVRLPILPISLEEIRSEVSNPCVNAAGLPRVTQAMWQEVKKSLSAAATTEERNTIRYYYETFEREVAAESLVVVQDRRQRATARRFEPFRSTSLQHLDSAGFYEARPAGEYLLGPGTSVFLDDWFEDTHCLGLVSSSDSTEVGVRFRPNRERNEPEITGTLWLDATTYRLKRADFTYVNLPSHVPTGSRGQVDFEHLPGGTVIVDSWSISSPIIELSEINVFGQRRPVDNVVGTLEHGGEVLQAVVGTDTIYRAPRGTVRGVVYDSVNRVPIQGAVVVLAGTMFESYSDYLGNYEISYVPAGSYSATFEHPRLELFGYQPKATPVRVEPRTTRVVDFGIPREARLRLSAREIARIDSIAAVLQSLAVTSEPLIDRLDRLAANHPSDGPASILGRVVDHLSGEPIPDVRIQLVVMEGGRQATTIGARSDRAGHFGIQALRPGAYLIVAEKDGYTKLEPQRIDIEPGLQYDTVVRLRKVER